MAECLCDIEKPQKFIFIFQCRSSLEVFEAESYFMHVSFNEGNFFQGWSSLEAETAQLSSTEQFPFEMRLLTKL